MLWQFFPAVTTAMFAVFALSYLIVLCVEHFDSYYGINKRKKRKFVFWGLKILEFTALMFIIETSINLMGIGTAGGFFHTAIKIVFSIGISVLLLGLIAFLILLSVWTCKGLAFLVKKIRTDIVGDIKRVFSFMAEVWKKFVRANEDYARVIAKQGVIHSIVHIDMLKWEVGWMRHEKLEEERQLKREAKERTERIRQLEKEYNESPKPTIKPLWYPGGKE